MSDPDRRGTPPIIAAEINLPESFFRSVGEQLKSCRDIDAIVGCLKSAIAEESINNEILERLKSLGRWRINDIFQEGKMTYEKYQQVMDEFDRAMRGTMFK